MKIADFLYKVSQFIALGIGVFMAVNIFNQHEALLALVIGAVLLGLSIMQFSIRTTRRSLAKKLFIDALLILSVWAVGFVNQKNPVIILNYASYQMIFNIMVLIAGLFILITAISMKQDIDLSEDDRTSKNSKKEAYVKQKELKNQRKRKNRRQKRTKKNIEHTNEEIEKTNEKDQDDLL